MILFGWVSKFRYALIIRALAGCFSVTLLAITCIIGDTCEKSIGFPLVAMTAAFGELISGPLSGQLTHMVPRNIDRDHPAWPNMPQWLQERPFSLPMMISGALYFATFLLALFFLQDTTPRKRTTGQSTEANSWTCHDDQQSRDEAKPLLDNDNSSEAHLSTESDSPQSSPVKVSFYSAISSSTSFSDHSGARSSYQRTLNDQTKRMDTVGAHDDTLSLFFQRTFKRRPMAMSLLARIFSSIFVISWAIVYPWWLRLPVEQGGLQMSSDLLGYQYVMMGVSSQTAFSLHHTCLCAYT